MFNLPNEIWIKIVNLLDLESLIKLSKVNKFFFEITKHNYSWDVNYSLVNYDKKIKFIEHCHRIKYLRDYTVNFKYYISEFPKFLKNDLKVIKIRAFNLYDLEILKYNKDVKVLDVRSCYNIDNNKFLNLLQNFKHLKELAISNTLINDSIIPLINTFNLKSLSFEACISLQNLDSLKQENLKTLKIISHQYLDNGVINRLVSKLNNIENLTLSILNIDIRTVSYISKVGKNLINLDISYSQNIIDDIALFTIAKNCQKLESLNLNGSEISNLGILYLSNHCPRIEKLSIAGTYTQDMALVYLSHAYPNLKFLEAAFINITRIGIFNLLLNCEKLSYLNVLNNNFSINYLNRIYKNINSLKNV